MWRWTVESPSLDGWCGSKGPGGASPKGTGAKPRVGYNPVVRHRQTVRPVQGQSCKRVEAESLLGVVEMVKG